MSWGWIWIAIAAVSGLVSFLVLGPIGLLLWLIPGVPPPGPLG